MKWLILIGLILISGNAVALKDSPKDSLMLYYCREKNKDCYGNMYIRYNAILSKMKDLKFTEEKDRWGETQRTYTYKNKPCGGWSNNDFTKWNKEQYVDLFSLPLALFECGGSAKINSLSKPVLYIDNIGFDLSGDKNDAIARFLTYRLLCNPVNTLYEAENQIFHSYMSCDLVEKNYEFVAKNLFPKALYLIVKKREHWSESIVIEVGEANDAGQMTFRSDSSELRFKSSFQGFEKFDSEDAIMIRMTGRLDRDLFDLDYFPLVADLKGVQTKPLISTASLIQK